MSSFKHNPSGNEPQYRGSFGNVWKAKHDGRDVAVKVIRTYSAKVLDKMIGVGLCYTSGYHVLTTTLRSEILQGGGHLEFSATSKYPATSRGDDVGESVYDGIRLDGEWKYQ